MRSRPIHFRNYPLQIINNYSHYSIEELSNKFHKKKKKFYAKTLLILINPCIIEFLKVDFKAR
jgi:hypothetical protein